MAYILYFLVGLMLANGIPYFVKGVSGERNRIPFRRENGPMLGVVWGTANLFVGGLLWLYASLLPQALGYALVALFLGILVGGITVSKRFEQSSGNRQFTR